MKPEVGAVTEVEGGRETVHEDFVMSHPTTWLQFFPDWVDVKLNSPGRSHASYPAVVGVIPQILRNVVLDVRFEGAFFTKVHD